MDYTVPTLSNFLARSDADVRAYRAQVAPAWDARLRQREAAIAAGPAPILRDPAQPDFMQKFVELLMQLRNAPPQQQGIPGVNGAPVQNPAPSQMPPPAIGVRG